jgi:hypothetical protein
VVRFAADTTIWPTQDRLDIRGYIDTPMSIGVNS